MYTINTVVDRFYDSLPPPNQRYCLTNVLWLLDTRKDTLLEKKYPYVFWSAKVYRSMTSGLVSRDTHRISVDTTGRALVLKSTIALKKSWGG